MARAKRFSLKQTADSRLYCRNVQEAVPHFHSALDLVDVIFMSLDFEGRSVIGDSRISQIGVSTLDTRQLKEGSGSISSRHISIRTPSQSFLFGDSECRGQRCLPTLLKSLFYIEDTDHSVESSQRPGPEDNATTSTKYRSIVLIGHGINYDLSHITEFQINIQEIFTVVDIVDTSTIARAVFEKGFRLVDLLEHLGCPYGELHNAGNDAALTLRAFLALAIKTGWSGPQHWLSEFQKLSYASIDVAGILKEKLAKRIANGRAAKLMRDRQNIEKDWGNKLENEVPLDLGINELFEASAFVDGNKDN